MSPAERLAIAAHQADGHAAGCIRCAPPTLDRAMTPQPGHRLCLDGQALDRAWLTAWRRCVDALTGVR